MKSKLLKTIILSTISIVSLAMITACSTSKSTTNVTNSIATATVQETQDTQQQSKDDTEGLVNKFMQLRKNGKVEEFADLISSKYLDAQNITKDKYIAEIKNGDFKNPITISDYKITSINNLSDNLKEADVSVRYIDSSNKEQVEDIIFAVVNENGNWGISPDGIYDSTKFNSDNIQDGKLNIVLSSELKYTKGSYLKIRFVNKSGSNYNLGWTSGAKITVDTDKGQYIKNLDKPESIKQGLDDFLTVDIPKLEGTIKQVKIDSVIELDKGGLPKNNDGNGAEYIIYK